MGELARRHHFVPEFYLSGFTDDGSRDGKFHIFDKVSGRGWQSSVKDAGVQKDLNLLECENGIWTDAFETELSITESRLAPTLREVISTRRFPLVTRKRADLLRFVALSLYRTPAMRAGIIATQNAVAVGRAVDRFNDGTFEKEFLAKHGRAPTADDEKLYKDAVEAISAGSIQITINQTAWVEVLTSAVNELGPMLALRNWDVLFAKDRAPNFITSDTPVVLTLRKPELYPEGCVPGISTLETWVVMPLNTRVALIGSIDGKHPRGAADVKQVGFINKLTIDHASRFLYGPAAEIVWKHGNRIRGTANLSGYLDQIREVQPRQSKPTLLAAVTLRPNSKFG